MAQKMLGLVLIVTGAVLLAISLAVDLLGLGASAGIDWKQAAGVTMLWVSWCSGLAFG